MTKILLLGLGRWGLNHLRNLRLLPVELFVVEHEARRLAQARDAGIPESRLGTRHHDFLDRVDAAVIVTPAPTHFPLVREFLEAGKDVFVEKPMTLAAAEARQLAELAESRGRILQVGHIFRHHASCIWMQQAIAGGQFGRLRMLRGHNSGFKRPRADSGMLFADAVHFVDLFNSFFGRTPARVQAVLQDFLGRGMDDACLLSLEYETSHGMVWTTVETNCHLPGKVRELTVIGSDASAVADLISAQNPIRLFANRHLKGTDGPQAMEGAMETVAVKFEEPLKVELEAFVRSIQTRQRPLADGWAGYDSIRVLEAAVESARLQRMVAVK